MLIEQERLPMTFARCASFAVLTAAFAASAAQTQAAAERIASHNDWTVFVAGEPKECYIVSQPTSSKATRDGKAVEVDRGDIRLFVRFNPSENVKNEVSFTGGYPLRAGTAVKVALGSETFSLNPGPGDASGWAWPSAADDARMVASMRRGSTAVVTGVSSRGTTTVDNFSLSGFTAAVNEAESRCK
jgi:invasion protein IalB